MKKILITLILLVLPPLFSISQILDPVKWSFKVEQTTPDEATLLLIAKADKNWHVYSQDIPKGGPLPTTFAFTKSKHYELVGKVQEPKPIVENDPNFDMILKFFADKAVFKQKIKVLSKNDFVVKGVLNFMCCDDKQCLPPSDVEFDFSIKGNPNAVESQTTGSESANAAGTLSDTAKKTAATAAKTDSVSLKAEQARLGETAADKAADQSLLWFFLISFLAGLAAIITPCVFPMIPMTVTFFMHDSANKRKARLEAIVYGLSIVVIYTVIGTVVAITLGANFANFLSTHWIPNVFFFLIFMVFAASFLGMFEITLPSWIVNKADKQADKGGFSGAFFMAFTLVLVSFSCTGPIVGAILVKSASGAIVMPIVGMLGFSLAFALPFGLFAFFPSWLSGLPKSGGWLNSVKVVLGFLELALGLKFLSIADQTYHWHILDREVYLAFWIVIFFLMGMYLIGKLKFNHDSDLPYISVPRIIMAIIVFAFTVYMIPGMWGAPLKALSGYLPPTTYQDFDLNAIIKTEVGAINVSGGGAQPSSTTCDKPKYADFLKLPHGLEGYFDYSQALACSKKLNKPIFIDFTGHGCVNCRQMEANVWSDPKVLKRLRENFIVTALYVDDKTELPENEWITSTYDKKVKTTIGKKFADLQITRFNVNSQPYYVLLDTNGNLIAAPRAYNLDVEAFVKFLDDAVKNFNQPKRQ
ncbi:MAG: protein-disulfide reductase DsbD family protein [Bacteroidetes bacterium]|nr:protein-disulfide reductase DsbD family protein [Bacteroidota bacterium]